jgi:uracil phosphoribosyltransferase
MNNVFVSPHPLVKHKLALLRNKTTNSTQFRELVRELAILLCYEATQDLALSDCTVETPLGMAKGAELKEKIGMMPSAEVWHIGLYRDERTLRPVSYYNKLPVDPRVQVCLILDPMLATGGSAVATVDILKDWGAKRVKFVGLIAAPEGIRLVQEKHPDVPIHIGAIDERLNEVGFIVPGLGDAGDRQFGTG